MSDETNRIHERIDEMQKAVTDLKDDVGEKHTVMMVRNAEIQARQEATSENLSRTEEIVTSLSELAHSNAETVRKVLADQKFVCTKLDEASANASEAKADVIPLKEAHERSEKKGKKIDKILWVVYAAVASGVGVSIWNWVSTNVTIGS